MDFPLISLLYAGRERRSDPSYYWDNRKRAPEPLACVLQRTRAGVGFIEADGTLHRVPPGHAMLFAHGDDSSYGYPPDAQSAYELDFITLTGEGLRPLFLALQRQLGPVIAMPENCEASRALDDLISRYLRQIPENRFQESARAYRFLMACAELPTHESGLADPMHRAREYALSHYTRPFTQSDLAREVGLSREHLARRFKAAYGQSPGRFCAELRLSRAKDLLQASHAGIEQIALQCGYLDANTFSRAFKAKYGRPPTRFREQR
ncbi:MAG: helix-turn-helix domain-containing protein [Opitutales bacterium]